MSEELKKEDLEAQQSLMLPAVAHWAVAWTRARAEKALSKHLLERGVAGYLPLIKKKRVYGRHKRVSWLPLFPGYVFFDFKPEHKQVLWDSRYVVDVIEPSDQEQLQRELESLARALKVDDALRECRFSRRGMPVEVIRGPLKGVEGELVRLAGESRLVIRVSFIQRSAELLVDESAVEPLR